MKDIIYVLINEAMPGYVKIGRTANLEQRIRSLDTTSVPLSFECVYACTVVDSAYVEARLHDAFLDQRVRSNREFFEISPDRVISALKLAAIEDVTPKKDFVETLEDQQALNQARTKRGLFNFEMVDIPVGSVLTFINDTTITAEVADKRSVIFRGRITSLSNAAQEVLSVSYPVAGPIFWTYGGETLDNRRRNFEKGLE